MQLLYETQDGAAHDWLKDNPGAIESDDHFVGSHELTEILLMNIDLPSSRTVAMSHIATMPRSNRRLLRSEGVKAFAESLRKELSSVVYLRTEKSHSLEISVFGKNHEHAAICCVIIYK